MEVGNVEVGEETDGSNWIEKLRQTERTVLGLRVVD